MVKCILAEQGRGGRGSFSTSISPTKLEINNPPTKTQYSEGETFSITGLIATIYYGIPDSTIVTRTSRIPEDIPYSKLSITPNEALSATDTRVTISYDTVGASIPITVRSINLGITPPTKTTYTWGENFDTTGLIVATSDGTIITDYILKIGSMVLTNGTPLNNNTEFTIGINDVTISYTDSDGNTLSSVFQITINKAQVTVPEQSGTLIYNGSLQSPTWNSNYNSDLMEVTTAAQTNAGNSYSAIFTLKDITHYEWTDGTIDTKSVTWTIGKKVLAASDITVTGNTSLDTSNLSTSITITTPIGEVDTITISPTIVEGLIITPYQQNENSRIFEFTSDGSEINQGFTVNVAEGRNYTAGSFANMFTITATVGWQWGEDGGVADEEWFNGLNEYLTDNLGSSLRTSDGGEILGTTKSVTLTTSVLGTTTHLIRVIGIDQDADNTVTFQTKNCLNESTLWSTTAYDANNTTAAMWTDPNCKAKAECVNYYNAFPGKSTIRAVNKGTCPDTTDYQRNETPEYNNETVFLLSERELGLDNQSPLSVANSTTAKAECTEGKNFSYDFYTSDQTRIMYLGDTDTSNNGFPWERSRDYNSYSPFPTMVCAVNYNGTAGYGQYDRNYGLAPAFVIGTT